MTSYLCICCSITTEYPAAGEARRHGHLCGEYPRGLVWNWARRKVAALIIKRNNIIGCIDLPCVGITCGVIVAEDVVAGPMGADVVGERTTRALAFDYGRTWYERNRTEDAVVRMITICRDLDGR
jgi:hypothetical protein